MENVSKTIGTILARAIDHFCSEQLNKVTTRLLQIDDAAL
jgi:hypothetical protein